MKNVDNEEIVVNKSLFEDYYNADMQIKMAHVVTGRSYWSFSIMIMAVIMTVVVLYNHYDSYQNRFLKEANVLLRLNKNLTRNDTLFYGTITQRALRDTLLLQSQSSSIVKAILPLDSLNFLNMNTQNPISEEIRKLYIQNYVDSNYISVPLLGIKISINDLLVLMGVSFFILSIWLYLCIRSENLTIGKILTLNQLKSIKIRSHIFYGICFNNMFFPTTQRKKPYSTLPTDIKKDLKGELNDLFRKTNMGRIRDIFEYFLRKIKIHWIKLLKYILNRTKKRWIKKILITLLNWTKKRWRREMLNWVFFLPVIIMGVNLYMHYEDIQSLSKEHTYTTITYQNQKYYINDAKISRFDFKDENVESSNNDSYLAYLHKIFIISLGITFFTFYFCIKTYNYQKGTSNILRQFKQRFKHESDCVKAMQYCENKNAFIKIIPIHSKKILLYHYRFMKERVKFYKKYSEEKGFYFLTHSGDFREVKRLENWLIENYSNIKKTGESLHRYKDKNGEEEYFIFLYTK